MQSGLRPWQLRSQRDESILQVGQLEDMETSSILDEWRTKTEFAKARATYVYGLFEKCERDNQFCTCHQQMGELAGLFHATELAVDRVAIKGLMQVEGVAASHIKLAVDLVNARWMARFGRITGL